ncbi:MAG: molybdopterin molybdotransferase MoeA, partial [bacterium]|nr:molybdopterin molybdotransferase MoeA [bacterium]
MGSSVSRLLRRSTIGFVGTVTFEQAREIIEQRVRAARRLETEESPFDRAAGRVLAEDVKADRDYPTLARSLRDGYAVRSADLPGSVEVIAEVRAGEIFNGSVGAGQAVEIMTGAPVPDGSDQVVMVEYTSRDGSRMTTEKPGNPGEWVNPKAGEARQGDTLIPAGQPVDYATVAELATVGQTRVHVYRRPKVAIIATGDEIAPVSETPEPWQIRNSNAHSLAVQVERAGGEPDILPVALDEYDATRELIERGLASDLLLLSGGVSAG